MPTKFTLPTRTDRRTRITKPEDNAALDYPTSVVLPQVHPGRALARELDARGLSANVRAEQELGDRINQEVDAA